MINNEFKKEINKRLKDELWDIRIANDVINKRKSIKSKNIKIISSFLAACFLMTTIYASLSFRMGSDQEFMVRYDSDRIVIMDDIISLLDETDFDIIFSQDIDVLIESAINSRF